MSYELDDLERELNALERDRPEIGSSNQRRVRQGGFRILPIIVAVLGLSGVGGVVYYAYTSGVKQGSEVAAPLLRPDGPAKIKPEDPGGVIVPHRDKSIYELHEGGNATEAVDQVEVLLPPPEDPMRPVIEAASGETSVAAAVEAEAEAQTPPIPSITEGSESSNRPLIAVEPELPSEALAAPSAPAVLPEAPAEEEAAPVAEVSAGTEAANAQPRAPKPPQQAVQSTAPSQPTQATQVANVSLGGSWRIQIAALRSEEAAKGEWERQVKRLPNILGSLQLQVQKVSIEGKGDFFRVRGGPLADKAGADAVCAQLKSNNVSCLSVAPNR